LVIDDFLVGIVIAMKEKGLQFQGQEDIMVSKDIVGYRIETMVGIQKLSDKLVALLRQATEQGKDLVVYTRLKSPRKGD